MGKNDKRSNKTTIPGQKGGGGQPTFSGAKGNLKKIGDIHTGKENKNIRRGG